MGSPFLGYFLDKHNKNELVGGIVNKNWSIVLLGGCGGVLSWRAGQDL